VDRPELAFTSRLLFARWLPAIKEAPRVIAFSPYITHCAITDALADKKGACRLYTEVTAAGYVAGGSKIGCLKKLFKAGVKIFHVKKLHAKVLLIPGEQVTIGSQNMTAGGRGNLEATAVWKDPKAASDTAKAVKAWMDSGLEVTEQLIKDLEAELGRLQREHRNWKNKAKDVTTDIWDKWEQEEERKRRAAEAAAAAAKKKHRWHGFKERFASDVIKGEVIRQGKGWSLSNREQDPPPSYCQWNVDWKKEPLSLPVGKWRPCFHLDTRQWGKARVYREVISFIDRGMGWGQVFKVRGVRYRLSLSCREPSEEYPEFNLTLNVHHFGVGVLANILGRYDISTLNAEVAQVDPDVYDDENEEKFDPDDFQDLIDAINTNEDTLQEQLIKIILERANKKSLDRDKRVDRFFEQNETIYTGLRVVAGKFVLVFSRQREDITEEPTASLFE
jgi:hypothetical protein